MRFLPFAALVGVIVLAGCGGSHHRAALPPWARKANIVCKRDDRVFARSSFDSEAMFMGLRRETKDLARVGFFRHVPPAAADLDGVGPLLLRGVRDGDFGGLGLADRDLLRAKRGAAGKGVRCSFGSEALNHL